MKRLLLALAVTMSVVYPQSERDGFEPKRDHARSMVMTRYGMVATSQTLAAAAGAKILEAGGNAIDAAIATNAVMGVVEPTGNGIGGDLFAIVYEAKTGKLYGLNSSGWSPKKLTPGLLAAAGHTKMPERGIHSVTVPGAVAGWDALHKKLGKLRWADLFAPAVFYASNGYPVSELIAEQWAAPTTVKLLNGNPEAKKLYLPAGRPPKPGEVFKNPELAGSLRAIATQGRDAFYAGDLARRILEASKQAGGTLDAADLAEFQAEWVAPILTEYRGWTVSELPPQGQGIAVLSMLNLMERFPLGEYGHNSARALHVMIEAKKLAYADMLKHVGDPRFSDQPVKQMLSKPYAADRARLIDMTKAACAVTPGNLAAIAGLPGADTIYLTTIDRDGNMVSLIQSNYLGFGSGVVPAGAGFMLQNRGALFTLEPKHPNTLAGRKRPLHTIIPGFMRKGEKLISFGIMGGWNQAQAHAQFVSNIVDFGLDVQQAMEAARFTKATFDGCEVSVESRIDATVQAELEKLGHVLVRWGPFSQRVGGGQAILRDNSTGVHFGGSDPRKDGAAIPESPAFERATP